MGERNDITRIGDIEEKERLVDRLVESLKVLLKDELHHAKQVHINCLNKVSYLSKKMTELNKASNDQTTESFDSKRFLNWRIICDKQHESIQKEHKTALELIKTFVEPRRNRLVNRATAELEMAQMSYMLEPGTSAMRLSKPKP